MNIYIALTRPYLHQRSTTVDFTGSDNNVRVFVSFYLEREIRVNYIVVTVLDLRSNVTGRLPLM